MSRENSDDFCVEGVAVCATVVGLWWMVDVPLAAGLMGLLRTTSRHQRTIRLFVVRFVFLCLSDYCTFVHTLVL